MKLLVVGAVDALTAAGIPCFGPDKNACCVIMASEGYPKKYEKGFEISIPGDIIESVYVAGAKTEDGRLLTSGGRVRATSAASALSPAVEYFK